MLAHGFLSNVYFYYDFIGLKERNSNTFFISSRTKVVNMRSTYKTPVC